MTRFVNVRTIARKKKKKVEKREEKKREKKRETEREKGDERGRWMRKRRGYFLSSQANRPGPEEFSCSLTRRYSAFVNFQDEYSRNI